MTDAQEIVNTNEKQRFGTPFFSLQLWEATECSRAALPSDAFEAAYDTF